MVLPKKVLRPTAVTTASSSPCVTHAPDSTCHVTGGVEEFSGCVLQQVLGGENPGVCVVKSGQSLVALCLHPGCSLTPWWHTLQLDTGADGCGWCATTCRAAMLRVEPAHRVTRLAGDRQRLASQRRLVDLHGLALADELRHIQGEQSRGTNVAIYVRQTDK
jgi:hypothetical protein